MSSSVVPFLEDQTFFITGTTGFLGKVLLAKLITTCKLREKSIYVLVRGKKELSAEERFSKDLLDGSAVFRHLLTTHPHARNLFRVVDGDIAKSKLGLSPQDYQEICENVSCIIHMAATTNFNENLRLAFDINVMGSRRIVDLAKSCKRLKSMVYTSTCYTNCTRLGTTEIREKVYPINFDPYEVVKQVLALTPEEADKATPHFIGAHPNTYTFSKNIAEHLLLEEKESIPLCVVRPSIIGSAAEFPFPGWVDSYIGASGIVLSFGLGLLHVMIGQRNCIMDCIPVDHVVNIILTASWHTALNPPGKRMPIYHASSTTKNPLTWGQLRDSTVGYFQRHPPKRATSWIGGGFTKHFITFWLVHVLLTGLPAAALDTKLVIRGKPPRMVAGAKMLGNVVARLSYFTSNTWMFANHNTEALRESLNSSDAELFPMDIGKLNWEIWTIHFCEGLKKFILKEDENNLEKQERQKLDGGGEQVQNVGKAKL